MGSSTRLFSIEMNVEVSTSVVRWFVGGFLPWVHCYFVEVQYESPQTSQHHQMLPYPDHRLHQAERGQIQLSACEDERTQLSVNALEPKATGMQQVYL